MVTVTQQSVATFIADGYTFSDHIASATHTLQVEDGTYKFYSTSVDNIEFINQ